MDRGRGTALIFAGSLLQAFMYGANTTLWCGLIGVIVMLKPSNRWLLLSLGTALYVVGTGTIYYDMVIVGQAVGELDAGGVYHSTSGKRAVYVKGRSTLAIIMFALTESLVIWRLYQLWRKAKYAVLFAAFMNTSVLGAGLFALHWRSGGPSWRVNFEIYGYLSFGLFVVFAIIVVGRTYWMSRKWTKSFAPQLRRRAYTPIGAFIDSGTFFVVFRLLDLALSRMYVTRQMLPSTAGIAANLILLQDALGRSSRDISVMAESGEEDGRDTPILDTLFSTPGVSLQNTIGGTGADTRRRIPARSLTDGSSLSSASDRCSNLHGHDGAQRSGRQVDLDEDPEKSQDIVEYRGGGPAASRSIQTLKAPGA